VIVPDLNLLVYAFNERAPHHTAARGWWEEALSGTRQVGVPWAVVFGFVRLVTHPAVLETPLRPGAALDRVDVWFESAAVRILEPGTRHLRIARELFDEVGVAGSLTTDVHLAALAIEHNAELHSNDRDFERFSGLRLVNPLS
jgi:hypothetical protein